MSHHKAQTPARSHKLFEVLCRPIPAIGNLTSHYLTLVTFFLFVTNRNFEGFSFAFILRTSRVTLEVVLLVVLYGADDPGGDVLI